MSLHSKQSLCERLSDRKFRDAFVSSRIAQTIATQARVLRQRSEMSQKDLARSLGTSQNAIYRLENPKYGRPNISTLKKLASFFEVGLIVRFAPLSEIADWTINLSEKSMDVPDFAHDTGFIEHKGPTSALASGSAIGQATGTDSLRQEHLTMFGQLPGQTQKIATTSTEARQAHVVSIATRTNGVGPTFAP